MPQKTLLQSAGDGTTVPAGYVGEYYAPAILSGSNQSISGSSYVTITGSSITIGPGVWMLLAGASVSSETTNQTQVDIQIWNNTDSSQVALQSISVTTTIGQNFCASIVKPVVLTSTKNFLLQAKQFGANSVTIAGFNRPYFVAVRIA